MMRHGANAPDARSDFGGLIAAAQVRSLVHDLPLAAAILDLEGSAWIWNVAAEQFFPPPPQTGTPPYPLFGLVGQPWFAFARAAALEGRSTSGLHWRLCGLAGAQHRVDVALSPLRDEAGQVSGMLALLTDTSRSERAERRAKSRAQHNAAVLDHLPDAVLVHRAGRIVYANRTALHWFGARSARQLMGRELDVCVVVAGRTRALVHALNGTSRDAELHATPMVFRNRKAMHVTLRELPTTEEARVHRSEERLRGLMDGLSDHGVIMLDSVGQVTSWNEGAEALTGYRAEDIIGQDLSAIYAGDDADGDEPSRALRAAVAAGRFEDASWKRRKDGGRFWCQLVVTALFDRERNVDGFAVIVSDVTQQRAGEESGRQTEDQVRQAQRMEAIGRLAGGIAHDFNNLLTAIQGHVQFLLDDLPEGHASLPDAHEIKKSADRAASLTRQLLTFSRHQELQPKVINLNEIIGEMGNLLRRVINEDIELQTNLAPELGPVRADPGQVEQVIMNLVVNARDAMPRGGKVTIRTANAELDDEYTAKKLDVGSGPYVLLSVSDTGVGMDRETQAHVFEPFFTTKEPGKGTGLGLATVYGIVKQSNGHIWVYSEPGHGTTFKIYLPRVAASGEALQRPTRLKDMARTGETILLVEDEPAVRNLARRVLESRGYAVIEAGSGTEALRIAAGKRGPIHLMLSDVVVPDMHGSLIAQRLHEGRPDVKLLFMSGYNDEDVKLQGIMEAGAPFIEKPFTPDLLARRVREVLDA